jgi:hypothetical protein
LRILSPASGDQPDWDVTSGLRPVTSGVTRSTTDAEWEDEMSETRIPKTEITGLSGAMARRFTKRGTVRSAV